MKRGIAVIFAVALAMVLPQAALAAKNVNYSWNVRLIVNEDLPGFVLPTKTLTVPRGPVSFFVYVPKTASGKHGVGISGGYYGTIRGEPVRPGYSTGLSLHLEPGDYTVFDSYKDNRAKGYAVKVHVTHARAKHVSYGARCWPQQYSNLAIWVKNVSCTSALDLAYDVEDRWAKNNFAYAPIVEGEFNCYISPFSAIGMKYACLAGDARVTWTR